MMKCNNYQRLLGSNNLKINDMKYLLQMQSVENYNL